MDIKIVEDIKGTLQIVIKCKKIDDEINRLKNHIELFDKKLYAKKDNQMFFVNSSDILYFDSVDNRTFLYTKDDVMEIKQRLYELEISLSDKDFVRISKSQIVNINKIRSLKPEQYQKTKTRITFYYGFSFCLDSSSDYSSVYIAYYDKKLIYFLLFSTTGSFGVFILPSFEDRFSK